MSKPATLTQLETAEQSLWDCIDNDLLSYAEWATVLEVMTKSLRQGLAKEWIQ